MDKFPASLYFSGMTAVRQSPAPVDYEELWSGGWNDATRYGPACRHRRRIVGHLVRGLGGRRVCDLGCGDGMLLAELAAHTPAEYWGYDISPAAIQAAQRRLPAAHFAAMDLADFKPEQRFDVVILSEVLEHLEDDAALLARVAPHARHVVVSVPGGPADQVDRRFGHLRNYHGRTLPDLLERSGFECVFFRRWGWPFHEALQALMRGGDQPVTSGAFSPAKRAVSQLLYGLFFLNVLPSGSQVFAVGKSRVAG